MATILQLSVDHGWLALDCSTSEFIDPNDPSHAGWDGFQRFRDKVIDPDANA